MIFPVPSNPNILWLSIPELSTFTPVLHTVYMVINLKKASAAALPDISDTGILLLCDVHQLLFYLCCSLQAQGQDHTPADRAQDLQLSTAAAQESRTSFCRSMCSGLDVQSSTPGSSQAHRWGLRCYHLSVPVYGGGPDNQAINPGVCYCWLAECLGFFFFTSLKNVKNLQSRTGQRVYWKNRKIIGMTRC